MTNLGMPGPASFAMAQLGRAFTPQVSMPPTLPINNGIAPAVSPMGAAGGFDWRAMLPLAAGLLGGPGEPPPQTLQAPGLLMPNIQIQPYQPPPLTALGGLLGGGR